MILSAMRWQTLNKKGMFNGVNSLARNEFSECTWSRRTVSVYNKVNNNIIIVDDKVRQKSVLVWTLPICWSRRPFIPRRLAQTGLCVVNSLFTFHFSLPTTTASDAHVCLHMHSRITTSPPFSSNTFPKSKAI